MFLWFIGTAVVSVWYIFRDPRFDYRLLAVGAVLPDVIDLPDGQARWAHSLTVAVGALVLVMLLTAGRKPIRRLLLAIPIGMLMHLVWDGAFASTQVFWWPFTGSWGSVRVPSLQRGWSNVAFEARRGTAAGVDVATVRVVGPAAPSRSRPPRPADATRRVAVGPTGDRGPTVMSGRDLIHCSGAGARSSWSHRGQRCSKAAGPSRSSARQRRHRPGRRRRRVARTSRSSDQFASASCPSDRRGVQGAVRDRRSLDRTRLRDSRRRAGGRRRRRDLVGMAWSTLTIDPVVVRA